MDESQSTSVLAAADGSRLVQIARHSLEQFVNEGTDYHPDPTKLSSALIQMGCCFVTLTNRGQLRGCMGHTEPQVPLAVDAAANAVAAASRDPRFMPIVAAELAGVRLEVTVLSPMQSLAFDNLDDLLGQLRPHVDGVLLAQGQRRALLLPQVWQRIAEPADFLGALAYKAGIPATLLSTQPPAYRVMVFQVQIFAEPGYREPT